MAGEVGPRRVVGEAVHDGSANHLVLEEARVTVCCLPRVAMIEGYDDELADCSGCFDPDAVRKAGGEQVVGSPPELAQ